MTSSIQHLPAELLHHICSFCSGDSIRNVRLSSRDLCKVADEYLLPEVVAFYHRHSLNRVEQIASAAPTIRNSIHSLFFQADGTDPELSNFDEDPHRFQYWNWCRHQEYERERLRTAPHASLVRNIAKQPSSKHLHEALVNYTSANVKANRHYTYAEGTCTNAYAAKDDELKAAFQHYNKLYEDEASDALAAYVRSACVQLFSACPNLKTMSVGVKDILRSNANFASREWLRGLCVPHNGYESGAVVFKAVMMATLDASLRLEDLSIGLDESIIADIESEPKLLDAMSGLKRLLWRFETPNLEEDDPTGDIDSTFESLHDHIDEGLLANVLSNCKQLEILHLEMMYHPVATWRANFDQVMEEAKWSNLKDIRLDNLLGSVSRLRDFFFRHSSTLEVLRLHNLHCVLDENTASTDGSQLLETFFAAIAGQLPKLKSVELTGRFTSYTSNGPCHYNFSSETEPSSAVRACKSIMEDYVLSGKGKPVPVLPSKDEGWAFMGAWPGYPDWLRYYDEVEDGASDDDAAT